jgi:hypothetical protein
MTSIEWLIEQYEKAFTLKVNNVMTSIIEQAKEMHKQEIIDAYKVDVDEFPTQLSDRAEQYYQETFVSKGSDNHIVDTNEMVELPQQEISDEEIDNAVVIGYENVGDEKLFPNHTDKDIWMNGFYEGAKWYREQLKQK